MPDSADERTMQITSYPRSTRPEKTRRKLPSEGCASILWKDASKVAQAAECLKMTAPDLIKLGAVERVIPEQDFSEAFYASLKEQIAAFFEAKSKLSADRLVEERYARFRKF